MQKIKLFYFILFSFYLLCPSNIFSQGKKIDVEKITRAEISKLTNEELMNLDFEALLALAQKLGVSIDELLNQSLSVASLSESSPRQTPGIVSIITSEQIQKTGARDLFEVLRTVPGIYFGYDVDNITSISMRGIWGHEGKILLMLDGMELNEGMYSTTPMFKHISADQISRIEIIRGPGSALYGGYSELGVIKIITKKGDELNGAEFTGHGSSYAEGGGSYGATGSFGQKVNNTTYSIHAGFGIGDRSAGSFTNTWEQTANMENECTETRNSFVNFQLSSGNFHGSLAYDNYNPKAYMDYNDDVIETVVDNKFTSFLSDLKYDLKVSDKLTLTPQVLYKNQLPWHVETEDWYYKRNYSQLETKLMATWNITNATNIIAAVGNKYEKANISEDEINTMGEDAIFINDKDEIDMNTTYGLAQINYSGKFGSLFGGFRVEDHSKIGRAFAPRLGYTKVFDKFHFKTLFNKAFRTPSIENYNLNPDISEEKTTVYEVEIGYKLTDNIFATANLYHITIDDAIIYAYDVASQEEFYTNSSSTGSYGFETEVVAMYTKWDVRLSYSHYRSNNDNPTYKVILPTGEKKELMQGMPAHMLHITPSVKLSPKFVATVNASIYSEKYGFITGEEEMEKADAYTLLDCTFLGKDLLAKNLDLSLSFKNIFNTSYEYLQPYAEVDNTQGPFPGAPFEVMMSVKYRLPIK
ncbi:TonB-dependent receptor plug domain-containing protein [Plebeiibacterium marinum]|uniref:TonB-dependent receptor plug domain-containing protein n=1 Tax=Plebeiibacterium marinum TaxID=2992111 RepID=A0AAE3MD92_9BACT|nr:TonB-dependent receptor plug domain-containing protein [Plebeiobacterium marinum]MCW3805452.1 TonB-dependent receptor plug domain-containing protein [Plebeiobacterium marinum]